MPAKNPMRDYIQSKMAAKPAAEPADEYGADEYEPEAEEPEAATDCVSIYLALPMEQRRLILSGDLDAIDEWRDKVGE